MIKIDIKDFALIREGREPVRATVPCSLYQIMKNEGELPDLYFRDNISKLDGMFEPLSFTATVNLDEACAAMKHVYLTFSRIYADAEVYLNGKCYRRVHNYNRIYTVEVSDSVRPGENKLEIKCTKPLAERKIIGTGIGGSMEYDLCPYVTDVGIIGECSLIATPFAMIDKISVRQRHTEGRVDLDVSLEVIGECEDMRAVATLTSPAGKMYFGAINGGVGTVTVVNPELWWPRGLGTPSLYKLSVSLYCNDSLEDTRSMMIGLREIELIEDDTGAYMTVNGARFFPMGATYVMEGAVIPDTTPERLLRIISSSADANMNTLRLVGAGLYPDDELYRLCDEHGIMIWQDISLYYTKPPVAPTFAAGVYSELCDIMSRISHHACVALMYLCITKRTDGDSPASESALDEFADICYHIAEPLAERFASGIPFVSAREHLESSDESRASADDILRDCCSASLPPLDSLLRFAEGDDLNLTSPIMERHTAGDGTVAKMLVNMARTVRYPYDLDTLIYASQITAGYSVYRSVSLARLMGSGASFAVCRQLNDSWPSVCDSAIDFFGRRKALHYYTKRAFSPIFVAAGIKGAVAEIGVSNETQKPLEVTLVYALYDIEGVCHSEDKLDLTVVPHGKSEAIEVDYSKRVAGCPENFYLVLTLYGKGRRLFHSIALFTKPKHMNLKAPNVTYDIDGEGCEFEMLLRTDTLTLACEVSLEGECADLSDNFVSLDGDTFKKISIRTQRPLTKDALREKIVIRSVYDIGR